MELQGPSCPCLPSNRLQVDPTPASYVSAGVGTQVCILEGQVLSPLTHLPTPALFVDDNKPCYPCFYRHSLKIFSANSNCLEEFDLDSANGIIMNLARDVQGINPGLSDWCVPHFSGCLKESPAEGVLCLSCI